MTVPQAAYSMAKLPDLFHVDPLKFKRVAAVRRPGLQVLHLSLTPGQRVPRHNHPGYEVMLHCLAGQLTLDLADERLTLEAVTFYLLNASLVVRFIAKPA